MFVAAVHARIAFVLFDSRCMYILLQSRWNAKLSTTAVLELE